ncbi:hypothetical protein KAM384_26850 [Aeromonas caviae]|nr:hypothetical protein KAM384_26850 [Aeromonas caviae]
MVEMLSRYCKYLFINEKEFFVLLAYMCPVIVSAYYAIQAHPTLAIFSMFSSLVLVVVRRMNAVRGLW